MVSTSHREDGSTQTTETNMAIPENNTLTRGSPGTVSPFHPGEQAVQERLGVRSEIEPWARQVVRDHLPEEHRQFYANLPYVVVAARDAAERPWATLLTGEPGFISSPDDATLELAAAPLAGDALNGALEPGADVGLLGIDLAHRRRNRANGRLTEAHGSVIRIGIDQTFGNCPQHIYPRQWRAFECGQPKAVRSNRLSEAATRQIEHADTFFIASGHRGAGESPAFGMDASHRGGPAGFIVVENPRMLLFPDYAGNNHFNTVGNLVEDPRIGLLFVDFETGGLLQLNGTAEIDWDAARLHQHPGARRLIRVHIDGVIELANALPLRWQTSGTAVQSLRVVGKHPETQDVTSFLLEARDGGLLPDFEPGQHLPLEVAVSSRPERLLRTYSLSAAANGRRYRLSIKREVEGLVSSYLHSQVAVGDLINAGVPAGDFFLQPGVRPVVLVSAGVGITPMLSMLEALSNPDEVREVWFVHGARDGAHQPFAAEVGTIVAAHRRLHRHISLSRPRPGDALGVDFDRIGRINGTLLAELLPDLEADFYLCGPAPFMASLVRDLQALGVPAARIRFERFSA